MNEAKRTTLRRRVHGSVLVIVMMSVVFATFALIAFMERASTDLLVDQREALSRRLRIEAYSAMEVTLSVLAAFREVNGELRSPAEGWGNPLEFAGYTPAEGRVVQVTFEDESGKIPLPRVTQQTLTNLFLSWNLPQVDAETLADVMMGWMKREHVYGTALQPTYEQAPIPFESPGRSLRSFSELAAIDRVREVFFDEDGRPNELWRRFVDTVSLFDFPKPNLNGARPDTLAAMGQFELNQQQTLTDFLQGGGMYQNRGPAFFRDPKEAQSIVGPTGNAGAFSTSISALRVIVTVIDGQTQFRVSAVVAPPNGARVVDTTASATRRESSVKEQQTKQRENQAKARQKQEGRATKKGQNATEGNLRYPFTLLEIRENDAIPAPPPPPKSLI